MHDGPEDVRRQVVNFSFFRISPEWRRLPKLERDEQKQELAEVVDRWGSGGEMNILTYSLVGLRNDADMMIWRICYSLECMQRMTAEINHTRMAGYLQKTASFLGMTRHSQYLIPGRRDHDDLHLTRPGGFRYLVVFPFVKTRDWYAVPFEERQRIVREHLKVSDEFPNVRLNLMYSFGIDDQEFVMAFESDRLDDLVDGNMRLRETDNYAYVQRDTPVYACVRVPIDEMLEMLG